MNVLKYNKEMQVSRFVDIIISSVTFLKFENITQFIKYYHARTHTLTRTFTEREIENVFVERERVIVR
jgi:hypothetical protein